jgi:dTDP-4-amino-4,6-dideoxygalactose transaminase
MIYFNDINTQYLKIKKEINSSIKEVLESGWYIMGPKLENFEKEFAHYIGAEYCVGVASGTEAIALALLALNISDGDEVITTNVTAYPTIVGINQSGAKPVVVDIFSESGLIDYNRIEEKITAKTKAILPVHLYGQSCDMKKILEIAGRHNLFLVEDCAQSVGASYEGSKTGIFGKCSAFSFYPTKNMGAFGDGGAIATNDEGTYKKLLKLRNYGQTVRYRHEEIGINSRLDEIQAAILLIKLKYIDEWNEKRIAAAKFYQENLKTVECMKIHSYGIPNFHLFVIKSDKRDELIEYLKVNQIQSLIHYPIPVNQQNAFPDQKNEKFEVSQSFTDKVLSIPLYPDIKFAYLHKIVKTINGFKN